MATITLDNPYYYKSGTGGVSAVIGNDGTGSGNRRIVRYEFTSPSTGASHISFNLVYAYLLNKSADKILHFYIGSSSTSHASAGEGSEYTGVVTISNYQSSTDFVFTGEADIILTPNTKYYLWIFPSSDTGYCYYGADTISTKTIETTGGAGLVYIYNGSSWEAYQIYVYNGTGWDLYMPYIYNGSDWDLYT
jgi:hypothetical protein